MGLPLLHPDVFSGLPTVVAGHSTRNGGVSPPPFDTLNLGRHVGDDATHVNENRRRFCNALNADPAWLVTADQVHGADVTTVETPRHAPACDGLVTATPNLLLAVTVADCAAILFADPEAGVVGACHSGWRGTVGGIAASTVEAMQDLGARPSQTYAYVGPCIGVESFEVGPEVADEFEDTFGPDVVHTRDAWRRPHVDLKAAIRQQLDALGLPDDRVEICPHDTMQQTDRFFSYRSTNGGPVGSMFGAIGLVG